MVLLVERSLTLEFIRVIMGYREESLPISYLGVPIKRGNISKREWYPLIDKIKRRLQGWKARNLSIGGRLVLINYVLSAMSLYTMSIAIHPMGLDTN